MLSSAGEGNVVERFLLARVRLLRLLCEKKINRIASLLLIMTTKHDDMTLIWTGCCAFGRFGDYRIKVNRVQSLHLIHCCTIKKLVFYLSVGTCDTMMVQCVKKINTLSATYEISHAPLVLFSSDVRVNSYLQ